jgi:hypothetical protein
VVFWPCGIALVSERAYNNAVPSHGQASRAQIVNSEGSAEEILVPTDGSGSCTEIDCRTSAGVLDMAITSLKKRSSWAWSLTVVTERPTGQCQVH